MNRRSAFTLIELLVVISIIALLIAILLPALGAARTSARKLQNSTQLRGIHQGMVIFAQSNKGHFPRLDSKGNLIGIAPSNQAAPSIAGGDTYAGQSGDGISASVALALLLNESFVTPEYIVSPGDPDAQVVEPGNLVKTDFDGNAPTYSYAMLLIEPVGGDAWRGARYKEWEETLNSRAVIMTDRIIEPTVGFQHSIWTDVPSTASRNWEGTMVRNDNSTTFENSWIVEDTQYGNEPACEEDDIFEWNDTDSNGNNGNGYVQWN